MKKSLSLFAQKIIDHYANLQICTCQKYYQCRLVADGYDFFDIFTRCNIFQEEVSYIGAGYFG